MFAYIFSILRYVIIFLILPFYFAKDVVQAISNIYMWVNFGIVINLLWRDAKQRGLPIYHGLWAFLDLIGVIIYHLAFARKKKI